MRYKINKKFLIGSLMFACLGQSMYGQYTGTSLLEKNGESPLWRQGKNNSNSCTPSFNYLYNASNGTYDQCGHKLLGSASVAMGITMFKWEWPWIYNGYSRYYNWDKMGAKLLENDFLYTPTLLNDCAKLTSTSSTITTPSTGYTGNWTLIRNVKTSLTKLGLQSRLYDYSADGWNNFPEAWTSLIISELKAGRPVIFVGKKSNTSEEQYFVVDGYSVESQTNVLWYHINNCDGTTTTVKGLGNYLFNTNLKMVACISPNYPNIPTNVTTLYLSSTLNQFLAKNAITYSGTTLSVPSTKTLVLLAGEKISLQNVSVKPGGQLKLKIRPELKKERDITYSVLDNEINTICYKNVQSVRVDVKNANSWECEVQDANGTVIWRDAQFIPEGTTRIHVWDGSSKKGAVVNGKTYYLTLKLKNNMGQVVTAASKKAITIKDKVCIPDYTVISGETYLSPKCADGVNDDVIISTDASSFVCTVFDRTGKQLKKTSGNVVNGKATIIDGDVIAPYLKGAETYWYTLDLTNSQGGKRSVEGHFLYSASKCTINYLQVDGKNYFSPFCKDGENDYVTFQTDADSWTAHIYDRNGKLLVTSTGVPVDGTAKIFGPDHTSKLSNGETYWWDVEFKNVSGAKAPTSGHFIYKSQSCPIPITIAITDGENAVTPNCVDGYNDYIGFRTSGAETWTYKVYDRNGKVLKSGSGSVGNTSKIDIKGLKLTNRETYWWSVTYKNSTTSESKTGRFVYYSSTCLKSAHIDNDLASIDDVEENTELGVVTGFDDVTISPNPSSGTFTVSVDDANDFISYDVFVEDMKSGNIIHSETNVKEKDHSIFLSNVASGIYIVKIVNGYNTIAKKLIIK